VVTGWQDNGRLKGPHSAVNSFAIQSSPGSNALPPDLRSPTATPIIMLMGLHYWTRNFSQLWQYKMENWGKKWKIEYDSVASPLSIWWKCLFLFLALCFVSTTFPTLSQCAGWPWDLSVSRAICTFCWRTTDVPGLFSKLLRV